ncbi:MAG TPA: DUF2905 domain-containing protein [Rhodothermales bacterium]|nr:DUF2905 domain-containing protein [Rhodothermales bacterium]
MSSVGRLLVLAGIVLVVAGAVILLLDRVPGLGPGKLPGDFSWRRGNVRIFAPLGTMLLISIVLTLLLNLIMRLFR